MKVRTLALSLSLSLTAALSLSVTEGHADPSCHADDTETEGASPVVFHDNKKALALTFAGSDGRAHSLSQVLGDGEYLVVTFFSATCPCQKAHDGRLKDLHAQWHSRGVRFVAVDSEANSSIAIDTAEAKKRAYPFPILSDPEGKLADALGAKYATYTVVMDREGRIRYRGGIDSDKSHLTENARHYVRTALAQLLAGQDPNPAEGKALGCSLRRR